MTDHTPIPAPSPQPGPEPPSAPTPRSQPAPQVSPATEASRAADDGARTKLLAVRTEVGKAVVGQDSAVIGPGHRPDLRGHVLLEGVPGTAKTLLVRSLAAALAIDTKRVQFTPDLMPGDITGSLVFAPHSGDFSFRPGPVFTNLLLADEINRTPPKTQAALLEAMEERQVSVDGQTHPLPAPFLVAATQNPVEYEGTYPLPEAQLDRFLLKIELGLPRREDEVAVVQRHAAGFDPRDLAAAGLRPVAGPADLLAAAEASPAGDGDVRGLGVHRRHRPGHPPVTLAVAGREPPRRDGAVGDVTGLGVAERPSLRHPGRRQGTCARHAGAPPATAAGGRVGRRLGRLGPGQRRGLGAGAPMSRTRKPESWP